jgi:hypothetical protein
MVFQLLEVFVLLGELLLQFQELFRRVLAGN